VFFVQRAALARYGKPCSTIKMRVRFDGGGFSGGTAGALFYGMEHKEDPTIMRDMIDPYSLRPEGERHGPESPDKAISVEVAYDDDFGVWTRPFFMGPMNSKIVRRSNALLGYPYGDSFSYEEAMLVAGGTAGRLKATADAFSFAGLIGAAVLPPTRALLKRYVLPKPGEGPSRTIRENSSWEVHLVGRTEDGEVVRGHFTGEGDPGTESTSRMLVESALCLAQDDVPVGGGSWTPASAMAEQLLPRLTAHAGLTFEIEPPESREGHAHEPAAVDASTV